MTGCQGVDVQRQSLLHSLFKGPFIIIVLGWVKIFIQWPRILYNSACTIAMILVIFNKEEPFLFPGRVSMFSGWLSLCASSNWRYDHHTEQPLLCLQMISFIKDIGTVTSLAFHVNLLAIGTEVNIFYPLWIWSPIIGTQVNTILYFMRIVFHYPIIPIIIILLDQNHSKGSIL